MAMILGLQGLALLGGGVAIYVHLRAATVHAVQGLVLAGNSGIARWFSGQLVRDVSGPLDGESWPRVQGLIEQLRLPGDGYVSLLDEEGRILCDPRLSSEPSLRGSMLGHMAITPSDHGPNILLQDAPRDETMTGTLRSSLDETEYLATRYIPELRARLVVRQPESGLAHLSSRATLVMGAVAAAAGVVVLSLTALATLWVMRRYDGVLERINRGLEHEVERRTQENLAARDALIMGLAKLADCRDGETGLHLDRISAYSGMLASKLAERRPEIDEAWVERVRLASSMHDIGKVGVPDEILLKPARLTPEERVRMQTHTTIGAETLAAIRGRLGEDELLDTAIEIALEHHERWDGTGYPAGVCGEGIALPARIVALADVYDALTSRRVYKAAMSHDEARSIILGGRGSHFDPEIVDAFLDIEPEFDGVRRRMHGGAESSMATPEAGSARAA
ncbi:MAG: HD domain-containing protein [Phycisphaerales bacterium]|nr:HD domain-containing protein [Phycisphaerales bacterium]